jgi:flavin reductase (DIM6/NTAB) family NADH-FMN oxidoreductase RutF
LQRLEEHRVLDVKRDTADRVKSFMDRKIDVAESHYDRLGSPVASVVVITTVDAQGRINAAPVATCLRNNHAPTCFEFTMDMYRHTAKNILETHEFVVNVVPFDREVLERIQIAAMPFPAGVNELDVAGLTAIASRMVKAPRIGECRSHFECKLEWTKQWFETRLTIVGRVVAASVNRDCVDANGFIIHDKLMPAQYCGQAYNGKYLGAPQTMDVAWVYDGPDPKTFVPPQDRG